MEPRSLGLKYDLAYWDPITAYAQAIGVQRFPVTMNCQANFTSTDEVQLIDPIEAVSEIAQQRTWIHKVDFDLVVPSDAGQVLSTMTTTMRKQQPGLSVRVWVESEPRYVIASQYTPLENFVNGICDAWPGGWMLYPVQSIHMAFLPTVKPPVPYTVTVTYTGWQYIDPTIQRMTRKDARDRLKAMGIPTICDPGAGAP